MIKLCRSLGRARGTVYRFQRRLNKQELGELCSTPDLVADIMWRRSGCRDWNE
jgi:hypothetical protein